MKQEARDPLIRKKVKACAGACLAGINKSRICKTQETASAIDVNQPSM